MATQDNNNQNLFTVMIKDIEASGFSVRTGLGKLFGSNRYFARITVINQPDQKFIKTANIEKNKKRLKWRGSFAFELLHEPITMRIDVFLYATDKDHKLLGSAVFLLDKFNSAESTESSHKSVTLEVLADNAVKCSLKVVYEVSMKPSSSAIMIVEAQRAADTTAQMNVLSSSKIASELLEKVGVFMKITEKLFDINPYTKIAFAAINAGFKIMDNLVTNDASIQNLVQAMLDSVNIHISTEELVKNKFQQQLLQRLCQQITECALFIQAYSEIKSSGERGIKTIFTDINIQIQNFQTKFIDIQSHLTAQTVMHIDYAIHHITDGLNKIVENLNIDKLPVITGTTGIDQAKGCLPGTREVFLNDLIQWIYNPGSTKDSSQVMIITGAAGTGKSSIAHTMAFWLTENKHLGCFFGFNHSIGSEYWKLCFSTIAKKLAGVNAKGYASANSGI